MKDHKEWPRDARLLEILGRYGDPYIFEMPTVMKTDLTCDLSFSGYASRATGFFTEPNDPYSGISKMRNERPRRNLTLTQIINLCCSY